MFVTLLHDALCVVVLLGKALVTEELGVHALGGGVLGLLGLKASEASRGERGRFARWGKRGRAELGVWSGVRRSGAKRCCDASCDASLVVCCPILL